MHHLEPINTAGLTLASGALYAHFGASGFQGTAGLCATALPLAFGPKPSGSAPAGSVPAG